MFKLPTMIKWQLNKNKQLIPQSGLWVCCCCVFSMHVFCVLSTRSSRMTSSLQTSRDARDTPPLAETMLFLLLFWHVSSLDTKNIPFRKTQVKHDCFYWTCRAEENEVYLKVHGGRHYCTIIQWNEENNLRFLIPSLNSTIVQIN